MVNPEQFIADLNAKKDTAWKRLYAEFYPALCAYAEKLTKKRAYAYIRERLGGIWSVLFMMFFPIRD